MVCYFYYFHKYRRIFKFLHENGYIKEECDRHSECFIGIFNRTQKENGKSSTEMEDGRPASVDAALEAFCIDRIQIARDYQHISTSKRRGEFDKLFNKARTSFHAIRYMSIVTFAIGVTFLMFALYFALTADNQDIVYAIMFGGTGFGFFVAHFIYGPTTGIQNAYANLLQAEVASVNYLNQMAFWLRALNSSNPEDFKHASKQLNEITRETMALLEQYLEKDNGTRSLPGQNNRKTNKSTNEVTRQVGDEKIDNFIDSDVSGKEEKTVKTVSQ